MRKLLFIIFLIGSFLPVSAKHITGGEIIYDYKGPGSSNSKLYHVTVRLFRDNLTVGGAAMPPIIRLGIFNNSNNTLFGGYKDVTLTSVNPVQVLASPPCLVNSPMLDYSIGVYDVDVDLPDNNAGYTISYQTCCRIDNIDNIGLTPMIGATYTGSIPGGLTLPVGTDNSARFETGISIICQNNRFVLDFSATDSDNDSLVYSYADAYGCDIKRFRG